jgi:hypothetical protein
LPFLLPPHKIFYCSTIEHWNAASPLRTIE